MYRFLSENMPCIDQSTYLKLSSIRSAESFQNLKGKTFELCLAIELARLNSPLLILNHLNLLNSSTTVQIMKSIKDVTTSDIYIISDSADDDTLDKIDIMTTLMNGRKLVIQATTLKEEKYIIEKCYNFVKKHEISNHQLVFASLNDFNPYNNIFLKNTKCNILYWKGNDLIQKSILPLELLCNPEKSEEALRWLDTFYEKKRKEEFKEPQTKEKKTEEIKNIETKSKWITIRKYGQKKEVK